ncbi:unnamed protein product [Paramecium primaurelia]|uniref:UDP-N-acetylglucosamine--peptide N-acetylglucosaminyltransferase SPINDLY n=1 Tax=Paramecium primaurelia TaxID=5886 RepID=A0A8S1P7U3_PARPR|nr:unnamed protein product [Paramecium primaurelia]
MKELQKIPKQIMISKEDILKQGVLFENQGKIEEALKKYEEAITQYPDYADSYIKRANIFKQQGEIDLALIDYNEAIRKNQQFAEAYMHRGILFKQKGEIELALNDYNEAIRFNPEYADAYINRGILFKQKGEIGQALKDYNEAIRVNPKYADAYINRGVLYKQNNEIENALQDYNEAIKLNPENSIALMNRGVLYKKIGENEKALQDYNKALEFNPNYATAYMNRGILHKQKGEIGQALKDYNDAIRLNPNYASAYVNRGALYQQKGEIQNALQDYNEAIKLNPNYETAYIKIEDVFKHLEEEAAKKINTLIYATAYMNRGVLYKKNKQNIKALDDFNMAIKLNNNYADAYMNRGNHFFQNSKMIQALKDYEYALKLEPDQPLYLTNLASYYLKQLQHDIAQTYIIKAEETLDKFKTQQQQQQKWNLSNSNLKYIKKELYLLKQIQIQNETAKNQFKYLSDQLKQKLPESIQILYKKVQENLNKIYQPINIQLDQNFLQDQIINLIKEVNALIQEMNKIKEENKETKQTIQNLQNLEVNQISQQLKELNENQNMYYNSLYWNLKYYLDSMNLISTDLFQNNHDAIIESNSEKAVSNAHQVFNKLTSFADSIPIIGNVFKIFNSGLDFVFQHYKEDKFKTRLEKLNSIIQAGSIGAEKIENEIQFASIELSKNIEANLSDKQQQTQFRKILQQSLKEEKQDFRNNEYWIAGLTDAFIILKNLEKNRDNIIQNLRQVKLRQIIIQQAKEQIGGQNEKNQRANDQKCPCPYCIVQ